MRKSTWSVLIVLMCLAASLAFAPTLFSSPAETPTATPDTTGAMSPEDFKNQVQDINKQSQSAIQEMIAKTPSNPLPPPPAPLIMPKGQEQIPPPPPSADMATTPVPDTPNASAPSATTDTTPPASGGWNIKY